MPVYLFTFHAYRSWMPDHKRGYTRRGVGYLEPDLKVAQEYAARSKSEPTVFDNAVQRSIVTHLRTVPDHIAVRVHAVTTEPSHVHVLVSWSVKRGWLSVRKSIKTSLTKFLNGQTNETSLRLSRGASRKHVLDRKHFDHLMNRYLPRHSGVCWFENSGWIEPKREAREKKNRDA